MPRQFDTPKLQLHFSTVHFLASVLFFFSGPVYEHSKIKVLAQYDVACVGRTSNVRTRGLFLLLYYKGSLMLVLCFLFACL